MSRNQRLGLIALTVVVLVVAFVLIRPTDDSDDQPDKAAKTETTTTQGKTQTAEAKPKPPEVPTVEVRNGKPVGGKKTLSFVSGQNARIDVTSNKPSEVHLHGYDVEKEVQPGKTTTIRFRADIEGAFELEDHDTDVLLATVEVKPK